MISLEELQTIAEYGLFAPSAHNQQARKFFLISKKSDFEFFGRVDGVWENDSSSMRRDFGYL